MNKDICPVCGLSSTDDDCYCNALTCPTCGTAVVWFGDEEGTNPCKHVVALGGVGFDNTEWTTKKYEQMFAKYWKLHEEEFITTEDALQQFAESHQLEYDLVDNGLSKHAAVGVYILFKKDAGKATKKQKRPAKAL